MSSRHFGSNPLKDVAVELVDSVNNDEDKWLREWGLTVLSVLASSRLVLSIATSVNSSDFDWKLESLGISKWDTLDSTSKSFLGTGKVVLFNLRLGFCLYDPPFGSFIQFSRSAEFVSPRNTGFSKYFGRQVHLKTKMLFSKKIVYSLTREAV